MYFIKNGYVRKGWPGTLGRIASKIGGKPLRRVVISGAKAGRNTLRTSRSALAAKTGQMQRTIPRTIKRFSLKAQKVVRPKQISRAVNRRRKKFVSGYKSGRKAGKVALYGAGGLAAYYGSKSLKRRTFGEPDREMYRAISSGDLRKVRRARRGRYAQSHKRWEDKRLEHLDAKINAEEHVDRSLRSLNIDPADKTYQNLRNSMIRRFLHRSKSAGTSGASEKFGRLFGEREMQEGCQEGRGYEDNAGLIDRARKLTSRIAAATRDRRVGQRIADSRGVWRFPGSGSNRRVRNYGRVLGGTLTRIRDLPEYAPLAVGLGAGAGVLGAGFLARRGRRRNARRIEYGSGGRFRARRKLDRTGPEGLGPRTGRGLGYCPPVGKVQKVARLGSGGRFKALKGKLAHRGVSDPGALAAWIGRKKYGKKKFAQLSARGRRESNEGFEDNAGLRHLGRLSREAVDLARKRKRLLTNVGIGAGGVLLGRMTKPTRYKETRTFSPYFIQPTRTKPVKFKALKSSRSKNLLKQGAKTTNREKIETARQILAQLRAEDLEMSLRKMNNLGSFIDKLAKVNAKKQIIH